MKDRRDPRPDLHLDKEAQPKAPEARQARIVEMPHDRIDPHDEVRRERHAVRMALRKVQRDPDYDDEPLERTGS